MSSIKIVITGPESTGKSALTIALAKHFNGVLIDEYARKYISDLGRPYEYKDIEIIGRKQIADLKKTEQETSGQIIFIDTFLVITKVWFEVVFKKSPAWIEEALLSSKIDLFLLCSPDIPWIKDNVRENGGEMRNRLFKEYENNLIKYNFAYNIVEGFDSSRLNSAINHVESYLASRATI